MTRNRFAIILLAVLTAMLLAGCGNETTTESSVPEGLETFGTAVDPSAVPSQAQTVQNPAGNATVKDPTGDGSVGEDDNQNYNTVIGDGPAETSAPSGGTSSGGSSSGGSSSGGSSSGGSTTNPSASPAAPAISPPAPASTATPDEVREYVGKPVTDLIKDLGYPISSDYELIDEDDPDAGEIGTLRFNGFTVTTKRTADGEIITEVNEEDPEPSPGE